MLNLEPKVYLADLDPNAALNLRKATEDDIPAIHDLVKYWADRGRMLERSHDLLRATIHEFLVLETPEGGLAGCVGLHLMGPGLAEVRGLAVHPAFQGRGLGRWLVLGAEREARDIGLTRLFAWTYEQRFFEKAGYTRIPREVDTLPTEIYAECQRCPFNTNCHEIPMLKPVTPPRPVAAG